MENYVKAVLYAYPTLEKMEQAYTVHIRNMAVLSYRQDLPAVAMAGKIVGQILQKRKLAWLKALVEKSVRRLSDEEKEIVARSFRWKKQSGDNTTKTKYIKGIVITDNVCEIIVIDAPVSVSPPYAAG